SLPKVIFPEIKYIKNDPDSKILSYLFKIKNYFLKQFKQKFLSEEAALLGGIILGDRSGFSKEFKEAMNNSGTTHIVALSGYNVGILILGINLFLGYFLGRKKVFFFIIFFILAFVFMTGAQASVIRASILAIFALLASYVGRIYSFFHSVVFGAFLMVLVDPKILVYDLSFQLSFLSLLGIVYFKSIFDKIFGFQKTDLGFLNWKDNLTTTLAAQFGVLPLLLLSFGKVSIISFLANILILAFIPLTMFLGFLVGLLGTIDPLGLIISFLTSFILKYEINVIKFFGQFPTLDNNFISWFFIILIYVFLIFYFFRLKGYKLNV
ncbi:MAG: ComEC/Rec2 family competence protein, partial [Patescibacteria group bacterium]|nr:ComEC/Rec2 family competence protein [Patescibacteria group bacterium]